MLMRIAILSVGLLAAIGTVRADEEKIDVKDLPKPVLASVKAKFPEGKVIGAAKEEEGGKLIYEVALTDADTKIDVAVSAKGKILEVEKTIEAKTLPKAVAAALAAKYPNAKIKKAEEIVKYEENDDEDGDKNAKDSEHDKHEKSFEVVLAVEGKGDVEVKLSPAGKILAEEDDGDDENEKKEKGKD
jgi:Putative beta-lactamase-inhibitor-like, PepSY-like